MYKKLNCCKYCGLIFENLNSSQRANHSRWCDKNPKRDDYVKTNSAKQLNTPDVISKRNAKIKQAWADGKYKDVRHNNGGYKHNEETKEIIRQKALASPHRRLLRCIIEYKKIDGNIIKLDSKWEEELAKRLDSIGIDWIRPAPLKWSDDNGITHNYFPDFYLPKYDIYLDPKNPYAVSVQQTKINCLLKQIRNLRILYTLEECKTFNMEIE
jgi:hypothetical protein